jgi:hypothetical protein
MHALVRRAAGATVRLLVLLLTLGTSVPIAAHGDAGHDPCDGGVEGVAQATVHAPQAPAKAQHCEVCHWLRSLRAFETVVDAPAKAAEGGWLAAALCVSPVARLHIRPAPSRAPPA